jgi:acyl dehydratase
LETWQLGGDVGRRYGLLTGDLNPIHLHPLLSALFGFKRPIAHALFLVARSEAALRAHGRHILLSRYAVATDWAYSWGMH